MSEINCILFDCMETVVDVLKMPDTRLYAWWAYSGCAYEELWEGFDSFAVDYDLARNELLKNRSPFEESSMFERFNFMVNRKNTETKNIENIVSAISNNFWNNYKNNCFVDDVVKSSLAQLSSGFKCGIVSNFMVSGGIEDLLVSHGIDRYFDFVITSINIGWKKPHKKIYDAAHSFARIPKKQILFVGDDYVCDYEGPIKYGFDAILLDKENQNTKAAKRIQCLSELLAL